MNKVKELISKYKDVIPYLFFGVCTTLVNVVSYWILSHPLDAGVMTATVIAWLLAVLFAYITNRKWVFESRTSGLNQIVKEMFSFFSVSFGYGHSRLVCYVCIC